MAQSAFPLGFVRLLVLREDPAAEAFAAGEIAAGLGSVDVDGAELGDGIEGDTRTIAPLVHTARAVMLDDQFLRDHITRPQLDHQMAATAAAGAGWNVGVRGDDQDDDTVAGDWRPLVRMS